MLPVEPPNTASTSAAVTSPFDERIWDEKSLRLGVVPPHTVRKTSRSSSVKHLIPEMEKAAGEKGDVY